MFSVKVLVFSEPVTYINEGASSQSWVFTGYLSNNLDTDLAINYYSIGVNREYDLEGHL